MAAKKKKTRRKAPRPIEELVDAYIESKEADWSPNSQRSERYRLRGVTYDHLRDPKKLWTYATVEKGLKPYTSKTLFIRCSELLEFAMADGDLPSKQNVIKVWMERNASKFRRVYSKKSVEMTFEEAQRRILSIEDEAIRDKAMQLLATGMRFEESTTVDEEGVVKGKGGAYRRVPLANKFKAEFNKSYHTLYYHLKKIGLTPHMLRKLCATKMVELGAREADLMAMFGWRSSQMASMYVQAVREKELTEKMAELMNNKEEGSEDGE